MYKIEIKGFKNEFETIQTNDWDWVSQFVVECPFPVHVTKENGVFTDEIIPFGFETRGNKMSDLND